MIDRFTHLPVIAQQLLGLLALMIVEAGIAVAGFTVKPQAGAATCEGEQMYPGDMCEVYQEPGHVFVETKTYDDMLASVANGNIWVGRIAVAALVITAIAAASQAIGAWRRSRRHA
jgi:hypothetical protein